MSNDTNVWVIIPARNEAQHIGHILKDTEKISARVLVVDDGSSDETDREARKRADVVRHIVNMGKGAALKTGCDYAVSHGAKILIVLDADGQHNPRDIPTFLTTLKTVDIVFGYRKLNKHMPLVLKLGNFMLTKITKLLYDIDLRDTQCGFRAFTVAAYKKIRWTSNDYSMESEMIANVGKKKLRYAEVPIDTVFLDKYKGTTVIDGLKILFNMVLWRFSKW